MEWNHLDCAVHLVEIWENLISINQEYVSRCDVSDKKTAFWRRAIRCHIYRFLGELSWKEHGLMHLMALFLNFRWYLHHPVSLDLVFEESRALSMECTLQMESECLGIKADNLATWFERAYIFLQKRVIRHDETVLTASKDKNWVTLMILSVKFASLSRDISEGATSIPWVMKEELLTKATIAAEAIFLVGLQVWQVSGDATKTVMFLQPPSSLLRICWTQKASGSVCSSYLVQ